MWNNPLSPSLIPESSQYSRAKKDSLQEGQPSQRSESAASCLENKIETKQETTWQSHKPDGGMKNCVGDPTSCAWPRELQPS